MRLEESVILKKIIEKYSGIYAFKVALNLGCGDVNRLGLIKPWVQENIFNPLKSRKIDVVNIDYKNFGGVNIVKDLIQTNSLNFVQQYSGPKIFILTNVLEHIPSNSRTSLLENIYQNMASGDSLIISVPNDYPYHGDPIDTMYRPSPDDLMRAINLHWLESYLISAGSYKEEFLKMSSFKKLRKLLKVFLPFQKFSKWRECHRIVYLFKPYKISIVYGVK